MHFLSLLRVSFLSLVLFSLWSCRDPQTAVQLIFKADQRVDMVNVTEKDGPESNENKITLKPFVDSEMEKCPNRGDFYLQFDEDTPARELILMIEGLSKSATVAEKVVLTQTASVSLVSNEIKVLTIDLCEGNNMPELPDAGMNDDGGEPDAEAIDSGMMGDAEAIDSGMMVDAEAIDSGMMVDAEPLDGGMMVDAEPLDGGMNEDAEPLDSGPGVDAGATVLCGDGVVDTPAENCDDGNRLPNDGCNSMCQTVAGFTCAQGLRGPSVCRQNVTSISTSDDLYSALENGNNMNVYLGAGTHYISGLFTFADEDRVVSIVATGPGVTIRRGSQGDRVNDDVFLLDDEDATLTLHGVTVIGKIKSNAGRLEIYDSDLFGHDNTQTADSAKNEVVDIHGSNSSVTLERCRIKGGKKQGIHLTGGGDFEIVNNIIYENGIGDADNAALKIDNASSTDTFAHNTIAHNNVGVAGILCDSGNAQSLNLHHNLFWGHAGFLHTDHCCHGDAAYGAPGQNATSLTGRVAGCRNGTSSVSTLPFLNAPMDDYHLNRTATALEGSVLSNTTNITVLRDFDFQLRGSSSVNMGADEFQ